MNEEWKKKIGMAKENKSSVEEFADTIKDNPEKIIAWARREIKEYESLIKILETNAKRNKSRKS